jgi:hypothetical protein
MEIPDCTSCALHESLDGLSRTPPNHPGAALQLSISRRALLFARQFPEVNRLLLMESTILLHRLSASRVPLRRLSPRGCEVETGDSAQLRGRVTRQHANSNSGRNKR